MFFNNIEKRYIAISLDKYFKNNRIFHCISALQFDLKIQKELFDLADRIRLIASSKKGLDFLSTLLSHKRAVLYFNQPSSRTYLSFVNACQILGIKTSELRSLESSEAKGESYEDTIRTIYSYTDMLIIRHRNEKIADISVDISNKLNNSIPVINAGSGTIEHPTQSLLDVYTIYRAFDGNVNNKRIAVIGDLKRSRTVRSLIYILSIYSNISYILVSPKELRMKNPLKEFLEKNNITYKETDSLDKLSEADIIYMTRIQDEYDLTNESSLIDYSKYYISSDTLKEIKKDAIILHPLPRREEISRSVDDDPRAWYWKQEVNGLWIRTALISYIFGNDEEVYNFNL